MAHTIIYLHRLDFPSTSGQTIQVLRDYAAVAARGHPVHLFCRAAEAPEPSFVQSALARTGVEHGENLKLHFVAAGWLSRQRMLRAARAIVAGSPLGVWLVCRTYDHALPALALRDSAAAPVRVLMELHETALPHLVYREQGRSLRAWWSLRREREVLRRLDGLVATVGSQISVIDAVAPDHAPAVLLPNGVPAPTAPPHPRPGREGHPVRLRYAGQLGGWKNTDLMIEALAVLPERFVLEIAGGKAGAQESTRRQLERTAERLGAAGRVRYVGVLDPVAVPAFLADADVLLLPLGHHVQARLFTSPMKLFEYAASGVPMVVTAQPTTESLIRHEEHALLVPPGSPRAFAAAIERLRADRDLSARLVQ